MTGERRGAINRNWLELKQRRARGVARALQPINRNWLELKHRRGLGGG